MAIHRLTAVSRADEKMVIKKFEEQKANSKLSCKICPTARPGDPAMPPEFVDGCRDTLSA